MKTIFRNIRTASLALCAALTVSSCESFLETDPYDFVAPETFYSNEKNALWHWLVYIGQWQVKMYMVTDILA